MAVTTLRQMPHNEIDDFFAVEIERWRLKVGDRPVHQNIHGLKFKTFIWIFILFLNCWLFFQSVCCERSFSTLYRLKTWVRPSLTGERLCGLAMLHSHRNMAVNGKHFKTIWCLWLP